MITDILAKIETPEAMDKLNETLASSKVDVREAGKKKMLAVGVTAVRVLIRNLSTDHVDLIIHSLNVMGDMGDAAAVPAIRKLLHQHPEDPNVRFAAYEALGKLPLDKGAFSLAVGLVDPDGSVRSAAARAVDRHFNTPLAAGLMNMIATGDADSVKLVHTIIDAQCDNILLGLWEEEAFREPAKQYLLGQAHPDVRSHCKAILESQGYDGLSQVAPEQEAVEDRVEVFAVDDSKMILNIYRSVLHNLGYEPHLFEFPAGALDEIRKRKPALVLTDLNMPDISGIDLTRGVRELYSKEALPIVMVTTQDDDDDNESAMDAGVNRILQKPFTEEQIGAVLAEYLAS
jgi:CheY-like chemotaxis protein